MEGISAQERTNMAIHSSTTQTKHPFFDKHTVLGTILLIIWGYFIVLFPASFVVGIVCAVLRCSGAANDYLGLGVAFTACFALLIHKIWFQPELKGILFRGFLKTLRLCPVILIFWLVICLPDLMAGNRPQTFTLKVFSLAITAGFAEEVIFRGLPLSYLKRQLRSEKHIPLVVCITSVLFGLTHVTNILFGASVSASLVQGVSTTCIGIFLGAVFVRGGNILVPMLLHTLHDFLLLSFESEEEVGIVLTEEAGVGDLLLIVICLALAACGFFLVRKSKRSEICAMWAETWSQTTESQPVIAAESENTTGGTI